MRYRSILVCLVFISFLTACTTDLANPPSIWGFLGTVSPVPTDTPTVILTTVPPTASLTFQPTFTPTVTLTLITTTSATYTLTGSSTPTATGTITTTLTPSLTLIASHFHPQSNIYPNAHPLLDGNRLKYFHSQSATSSFTFTPSQTASFTSTPIRTSTHAVRYTTTNTFTASPAHPHQPLTTYTPSTPTNTGPTNTPTFSTNLTPTNTLTIHHHRHAYQHTDQYGDLYAYQYTDLFTDKHAYQHTANTRPLRPTPTFSPKHASHRPIRRPYRAHATFTATNSPTNPPTKHQPSRRPRQPILRVHGPSPTLTFSELHPTRTRTPTPTHHKNSIPSRTPTICHRRSQRLPPARPPRTATPACYSHRHPQPSGCSLVHNGAFENQLLTLINNQRALAGLGALTDSYPSRTLPGSTAMTRRSIIISHNGSDGSTYWQREVAAGYTGRWGGEIIYAGSGAI
jgi:uncharacterized protein YkwD